MIWFQVWKIRGQNPLTEKSDHGRLHVENVWKAQPLCSGSFWLRSRPRWGRAFARLNLFLWRHPLCNQRIRRRMVAGKVLSLLEACFDLISSPSPSMKIQTMGGKITENLGFESQFFTQNWVSLILTISLYLVLLFRNQIEHVEHICFLLTSDLQYTIFKNG